MLELVCLHNQLLGTKCDLGLSSQIMGTKCENIFPGQDQGHRINHFLTNRWLYVVHFNIYTHIIIWNKIWSKIKHMILFCKRGHKLSYC